MWKKDEEVAGHTDPETPRPPSTGRAPAAGRQGATIGPSIGIVGEVTGSEDLLIRGRIEGSVQLDKHAVTVGSEGRVRANISGRVISVEGEVEGDLTAEEQIVLRGTARVQGDIKAPRVVLEDGATFRGLVDMGARQAASTSERTAEKAKQVDEVERAGKTHEADEPKDSGAKAKPSTQPSPKSKSTTARPGERAAPQSAP